MRFAVAATIVVRDLGMINMMLVMVMMVIMVMMVMMVIVMMMIKTKIDGDDVNALRRWFLKSMIVKTTMREGLEAQHGNDSTQHKSEKQHL